MTYASISALSDDSIKEVAFMRRVALLLAAVGAVFAGVVGSALGATSVSLCVPSSDQRVGGRDHT